MYPVVDDMYPVVDDMFMKVRCSTNVPRKTIFHANMVIYNTDKVSIHLYCSITFGNIHVLVNIHHERHCQYVQHVSSPVTNARVVSLHQCESP